MNLEQIVMDSFKKIQAEGFVEATVEKVLRKTLSDTIEDTFRTYSDFGKQLEREIKEKLQINLNKIDIAQYNVLVLNAVKEQLDRAVHIQGVQKIQEAMQELLADPKQEYKLSELIEEMKRSVDEDERPSEITLHVEPSTVLTFIYFDEQPDQRKYSCKYRLAVRPEDGVVATVDIGDKKFDNKVIMGGLYGFERTLFRIDAHGSRLVIDENAVDMYYPDEYED